MPSFVVERFASYGGTLAGQNRTSRRILELSQTCLDKIQTIHSHFDERRVDQPWKSPSIVIQVGRISRFQAARAINGFSDQRKTLRTLRIKSTEEPEPLETLQVLADSLITSGTSQLGSTS